jgi:hypothetical protein
MASLAPSRSTRSNYWHNRTEQDLLEIEFTSTEPELLEGMSNAPVTPGDVVIEYAYDLRGRPTMARCVHCKYPNHFKGFVIRLADGSRRLVGKDCGRKIYGGLFDDLVKDFKTARELAGSLRRRQKLLEAEEILTDGLGAIYGHRALSQFVNMGRFVRGVLDRELIADLQAIAKRGDGFTVAERVRDYAAEARRQDELPEEHAAKLKKMNRTEERRYRRRHGLPDGEIYTWLHTSIGPLKGSALLEADFARGDRRFSQLHQDISNCFGGLRQQRRWTSIALSEASQRLNVLITRLEEEVVRLKAPITFFEHSHLRTLCEWALHRSQPVILRCGPGWLECTDDYDGRIVRAELMPGYTPPSTEFIHQFRAAIA